MAPRIKIDPGTVGWQPAEEVWPGYRLEGGGADCGIFVKVLRRPADGAGCWCALVRFLPPPGFAIRLSAVAASDEEVLLLTGPDGAEPASGVFTCNPEGLRHGNTLTADTTAYIHYHGDPDRVLRAELVALDELGPAR
ncbi:MAG: hypothetical protein ACYCU7_07330 [Acidimicrobiales bacterium]